METDGATVRDWQDGKCLAECSRYMLEQQIGCDIVFLVGENRQQIRAHKFILISRSPVFQAMFCGPLAETQSAIPIPDIEPETFQLLLSYMYYDADILGTDSLRVLYAAKKYCVSDLVNICRKGLSKIVNTENACQLLQYGWMLDEMGLVQACLSFVLNNGELCLKSEGMGKLSRDCVKKLIEADDLIADEITVWNALINWAHATCRQQQHIVTTVNIREILGDMLYSVRLRGISEEEFAKHVSVSDILSKEELTSIFHFYHGASKILKQFSMKPGRSHHKYQRCYRFQSVPVSSGHILKSTENYFSFIVSAPIFLCGIILFKSRTSKQRYVISGQLLDIKERVINEINATVDTLPDCETFDVMFDEKAHLNKNETFFLSVNVSGINECFGSGEQKRVTVGHTTFSFQTQSYNHKTGQWMSNHGLQTISGLIFKTPRGNRAPSRFDCHSKIPW